LKYLDGLEQDRADEGALNGKKYSHILDRPHRWESLGRHEGQGRQARSQHGDDG
jgi:type I restriction enzyme M protein